MQNGGFALQSSGGKLTIRPSPSTPPSAPASPRAALEFSNASISKSHRPDAARTFDGDAENFNAVVAFPTTLPRLPPAQPPNHSKTTFDERYPALYMLNAGRQRLKRGSIGSGGTNSTTLFNTRLDQFGAPASSAFLARSNEPRPARNVTRLHADQAYVIIA